MKRRAVIMVTSRGVARGGSKGASVLPSYKSGGASLPHFCCFLLPMNPFRSPTSKDCKTRYRQYLIKTFCLRRAFATPAFQFSSRFRYLLVYDCDKCC